MGHVISAVGVCSHQTPLPLGATETVRKSYEYILYKSGLFKENVVLALVSMILRVYGTGMFEICLILPDSVCCSYLCSVLFFQKHE